MAEAERHDGSRGTGSTYTINSGNGLIVSHAAASQTIIVEWLEITESHANVEYLLRNNVQNDTCTCIFRNVLAYDLTTSINYPLGGATAGVDGIFYVLNCMVFNCTMSTANNRDFSGISISNSSQTELYCYNNTVYDIVSGTSANAGDCRGFLINSKSGSANKNNIATDTTGTNTGTISDFSYQGSVSDNSNNASSDDTADDGGGSNHVISISSSSQYVSTTEGSEDLHLISGSDCIGAGVDLGTGNEVEIDIDGYDRDWETIYL